jgi:hypothetical protein
LPGLAWKKARVVYYTDVLNEYVVKHVLKYISLLKNKKPHAQGFYFYKTMPVKNINKLFK